MFPCIMVLMASLKKYKILVVSVHHNHSGFLRRKNWDFGVEI